MKEPNERWYNWGWIWMSIITALCFTIYAQHLEVKTLRNRPQIKPVECLTYYQWTYWSTKRDRVLNKRKRTRTDSLELRNADRILGLDETQNKYPPR
jgi:hypothetical protein